MSRVLLAMVFAVGLAGAANAAVMQFSIGGVPVGIGEVIEVEVSDYLVIDIWIDPEGTPYDTFVANVAVTGPWEGVPGLMDPPPVFYPPFAGFETYGAPGLFGPDAIFSAFTGGEVGAAQAVADWEVHIPDVPDSTILNLEFVATGALGPTGLSLASVPVPVTTINLELHVTPEPATLGLLVLGGLAALRRRFA